MTGRILIIDDEPGIGSLLRRSLEPEGLDVETFEDPIAALNLLKSERFDIILTDLRMPGIGGLQVLTRARQIQPLSEVVIMTGYASVTIARDALQQGALDYITKPFSIEEELIPLIEHILGCDEVGALEAQGSREAQSSLGAAESDSGHAGDDRLEVCASQGATMRAIVAKATEIARSNAPVLLRGEPGTGKQAIASLIHGLSARSAMPLVRIDCTALSESALECELFGLVKSARTGAQSAQRGQFDLANGGTLLLDEICEIAPRLQADLLRVLQLGEFHRVDTSEDRVSRVGRVEIDVRVIASTNRDLEAEVRGGRFRKDLYDRLSVAPLALRPLRERSEDIPELVAALCEKLSKQRTIHFSAKCLEVLQHYSWPGNLRELANTIEYVIVIGEDVDVAVEDLPAAIRDHERVRLAQTSSHRANAETIEQIEMRCILQTMERTLYDRTRAARLLGITRRALGYRIWKYKLESLLERRRETASEPGSSPASREHRDPSDASAARAKSKTEPDGSTLRVRRVAPASTETRDPSARSA